MGFTRPPILIDRRTGSSDLVPKLRRQIAPASLVQLTDMEFGDAAHSGNGPDGPMMIGYEMKRIGDILQCMTDGRFVGHQLKGLLRDFDVYWLVVEDQYRGNPRTGLLEQLSWVGKKPTYRPAGGGGWTVDQLDGWLTSLSIEAGVRVWRTRGRDETVDWLVRQYWWWQKPWEAHDTLRKFHFSRPALFEPPDAAKVASHLARGMGWEKAMAAALHFGSIHALVNASEEEWREVAGIGKELACRVHETIYREVKAIVRKRRATPRSRGRVQSTPLKTQLVIQNSRSPRSKSS